ncbi:hypothetical protein M3Y96_00472700 [Aphelenchoides besseyi]|nr:hypothetical protein M3Y96_00472700 [Aphelenchoides besseyi]
MNLVASSFIFVAWMTIVLAVYMPSTHEHNKTFNATAEFQLQSLFVDPVSITAYIAMITAGVKLVVEVVDLATKAYDAYQKFTGNGKEIASKTGVSTSDAITNNTVGKDILDQLHNMSQFLKNEFSLVEDMIKNLETKMDQMVVTAKWDEYVKCMLTVFKKVREPLRDPYETAIPAMLKNQSAEERKANAIALKSYCYEQNKIADLVKESNIVMSCDMSVMSSDYIETELMVIALLDFTKTRIHGAFGGSKTRNDLFGQFHQLKPPEAVYKKTQEIIDQIKAEQKYFNSEEEADIYIQKFLPPEVTGPGECFLQVLLRVYSYNYQRTCDVVKILLQDSISITTASVMCASVYSYPDPTDDATVQNFVETTMNRQAEVVNQMQQFFVGVYNDIFKKKVTEMVKRILNRREDLGIQKEEVQLLADYIHYNITAIVPTEYSISVLVILRDSSITPIIVNLAPDGEALMPICDDTRFYCAYVTRHVSFLNNEMSALNELFTQEYFYKPILDKLGYMSPADIPDYVSRTLPTILHYFPAFIYVHNDNEDIWLRHAIRGDSGLYSNSWSQQGRYLYLMAAGNYTYNP